MSASSMASGARGDGAGKQDAAVRRRAATLNRGAPHRAPPRRHRITASPPNANHRIAASPRVTASPRQSQRTMASASIRAFNTPIITSITHHAFCD